MQLGSPKQAAILGGGKGIGREIALSLARKGVATFIGDVDGASALAVTKEIGQIGAETDWEVCDVGLDHSVAHFADAAFERLGHVDIVFNHAGASLGGLLELISSDDWHRLLNVNIVGLGRSVSAFVPRMTAQGGGWIVNTSSALGLFHDVPFAAPYVATKAAIIAYSRALATYLRNRSIGVSVFCPDITATGFLSSGRLVGIPPELAAAALPVDRIQTAAHAAATLLAGLEEDRFLISAVIDTQAKLEAMAKATLAPGSEAFGRDGQAIKIIQRGCMRLPAGKRDKGIALITSFATVTRNHAGCQSYEIACDTQDPDQILIFEVWENQAAIDAHASAPATIAFIAQILKLGATDFGFAQTKG